MARDKKEGTREADTLAYVLSMRALKSKFTVVLKFYTNGSFFFLTYFSVKFVRAKKEKKEKKKVEGNTRRRYQINLVSLLLSSASFNFKTSHTDENFKAFLTL